MAKKKRKNIVKSFANWSEYDKWVDESAKLKKAKVCSTCGIDVVFNLGIFKLTGMCGTCSTGEARLNYEEEEYEEGSDWVEIKSQKLK